jgi:hypothetical protein
VDQQSTSTAPQETISAFRDLLGFAGRSTYLLLTLLALLILYPYAPADADQLLFGLINSVILIAAIYAVSASRRVVVMGLLLAVPTFTLQWLHISAAGPAIDLIFGIALSGFYLFTLANVLAYVLGPGTVTADKLHAAVSAYIVIALLWMVFYGIIDRLVPGSFVVSDQHDVQEPLAWHEHLFFSFATLTSTGYGYIVPSSRYAQSFAILEQLSGVFFVAVLIARLAGLYQPGSNTRRRTDPPS